MAKPRGLPTERDLRASRDVCVSIADSGFATRPPELLALDRDESGAIMVIRVESPDGPVAMAYVAVEESGSWDLMDYTTGGMLPTLPGTAMAGVAWLPSDDKVRWGWAFGRRPAAGVPVTIRWASRVKICPNESSELFVGLIENRALDQDAESPVAFNAAADGSWANLTDAVPSEPPLA